MTKRQATKLTASSIAGLVSAVTLMGIIVSLDARWLSAENPLALVVWLLALVTGVVTASFAWSFASSELDESEDEAEAHHQVQCPFCGGALYTDWRLCPHCGERIIDDVVSAAGPVATR